MVVVAVLKTLDEAGHIGDAIRGLAGQSRSPDLAVLVDGGSTDGTVQIARKTAQDAGLALRVGQKEGAGVGLSLQAGAFMAGDAIEARGQDGLLVFTDGDSILSPNWIEEAERSLSGPEASVFGTWTLPKSWLEDHRPERGLADFAFSLATSAKRTPVGRGMACRWSDFDAVNGYCLCEDGVCSCDPEWYEDTVLVEKLRSRGGVVYTTRACVYSEMPGGTMTSPGRWMQPWAVRRRVREMDWAP